VYVSQRYMCFLATEPDRCTVILPFRDVVKAEPMDPGEGSKASSSFADVNGVYDGPLYSYGHTLNLTAVRCSVVLISFTERK
jgi:hypothetical protein